MIIQNVLHEKFAVLIYLWSYFDYVWYNDEIGLVLTSWGSRNRASPPIHKTFFSYINLYKNISLIRLLIFLLNLLRDWVLLILEFLKGISATKCTLPSHVLKWAIYWTLKRFSINGRFLDLKPGGGWQTATRYIFAPPLKMGNSVPNKHEFGEVWTTFWGS